jgi:hypothetical protein
MGMFADGGIGHDWVSASDCVISQSHFFGNDAGVAPGFSSIINIVRPIQSDLSKIEKFGIGVHHQRTVRTDSLQKGIDETLRTPLDASQTLERNAYSHMVPFMEANFSQITDNALFGNFHENMSISSFYEEA